MTIKLSGGSKEIEDWRRWRPAGVGGYESNAYFDYYYSGADIKIRFSETPEDYGGVEVVAIGYNVVQQKVPIYGFWSYTYDAVAYGTRIVQGTFAIPFKGPHYIYMMLADAAEKYDDDSTRPRVLLSEDDELLDRYWGITRDEKAPGTKHVFLSHPPFDIIISYGQESYKPGEYFDALEQHAGDEVIYGINERFVNPDETYVRPRIFIENVNLTNLGMQIEPTGQPLMEAYTFFARDIYWEGQENFHNK